VSQGRKRRRPPGIDLHLHLEGSLPLTTLSHLARRHRLPAPSPRRFDGFVGFLKAFGAVCDLLADEDDFHRAARDVLRRQHDLGAIHVEVLFSPQIFLRRGVPLASITRGLLRARREASAWGLSVVYILDGVRQWGGGWLDEVVRQAAPWAGKGLVGLGVGGDEEAVPARELLPAFRRARSLGLHATIHAGEAAGPSSVVDAMEILHVDRIGHGIRASEDAHLMDRLARRGTVLEVCPTSNVATGVVASIRSHPLRLLHDAGVRVTINSDDGTFFGTDFRREADVAARRLGFSPEELAAMRLTAARAAFLSPAARRRLERRMRGSTGPALDGRRVRGKAAAPRPCDTP